MDPYCFVHLFVGTGVGGPTGPLRLKCWTSTHIIADPTDVSFSKSTVVGQPKTGAALAAKTTISVVMFLSLSFSLSVTV